MTRTVVALFDDFNLANRAVKELIDNGFSRDDVSIMASDAAGEYQRHLGREGDMGTRDAGDTGATEGAGVGAGIGAVIGGLGGLLVGLGALTIPGIGPVIAAGPLAAALTGLAGAGVGAVAGGVAGGLLGALVDMGVPEDTAEYYAEGVRRGGTLVTVRSSDEMTDRAVDILNSHNPVDINRRASEWRQSGWSGFDPNAEIYTTRGREAERPMAGMGTSAEYDVDRTRADMEMRDVDRPEPGMARDAGRDVDLTRRDEAAAAEQKLYPRDKYRPEDEEAGTEAERRLYPSDEYRDPEDVARFEGTDVTRYSDYSSYDARFRHHFDTSMSGTGYTYDQYQPAYRYGYDLATDERFRRYDDWDAVEPEARRYWDERNPGTWDRFKQAVRHAWQEIKEEVR